MLLIFMRQLFENILRCFRYRLFFFKLLICMKSLICAIQIFIVRIRFPEKDKLLSTLNN